MDTVSKEERNHKLAIDVSKKSIFLNGVLMVAKLVAGFLDNSAAMVSDGIHTATDVITTIIVIIGVKISSGGEDEKHNYGRDRYESIAAIVIAIILAFVGFSIGFDAFKTIIRGETVVAPGIIALIAAGLSIVMKEYMYRYTHDVAVKIGSDALRADALHHRSDALSSIGSLIGVAGARMGFPILDPLAGLLIALLIVKAGWDVFIDATEKLTDVAVSDEKLEEIIKVINEIDYVEDIDEVKTRKFGSQSYVDVSIGVCAFLPLHEAHDIATAVHDKLEEEFESIIHVMVHVNPSNCGIEDHYCRYPHLENRYSEKCAEMKAKVKAKE